jgi:hypothetical protein
MCNEPETVEPARIHRLRALMRAVVFERRIAEFS